MASTRVQAKYTTVEWLINQHEKQEENKEGGGYTASIPRVLTTVLTLKDSQIDKQQWLYCTNTATKMK